MPLCRGGPPWPPQARTGVATEGHPYEDQTDAQDTLGVLSGRLLIVLLYSKSVLAGVETT
jgi:hypothetical protein